MNKVIFIDGPKHTCHWKDNMGQSWWMDWTYLGPIFSRDNFQDGGCLLNDVPIEIRKNAEAWTLNVLKKKVKLTED